MFLRNLSTKFVESKTQNGHKHGHKYYLTYVLHFKKRALINLCFNKNNIVIDYYDVTLRRSINVYTIITFKTNKRVLFYLDAIDIPHKLEQVNKKGFFRY